MPGQVYAIALRRLAFLTADSLRIGYNGTVARILKPELPFDHASN